MKRFIWNLISDLIKINRTSMFWLHFLLPLLGTILFLIIYTFQIDKIEKAFTGFVGCSIAIYPILIGIVTGLSAEQESEAGRCQELLTQSSRTQTLYSKMLIFFILGAISIFFAIFGFALSFSAIFHITFFSSSIYLKFILVIFSSNIILYFIHWFLSFRMGKNISIGVGIVEMVLGMLLLTVLGDFIWPFVPCSWSFRLLKVLLTFGNLNVSFIGNTLIKITVPILTIFVLIVFTIWFHYWEGDNNDD